ncbi:uncharacterized protein LOC130950190 [Arachis stenosperma]|uniref:uncharacterized protein LOC130950190 n=1 Tax=Arachis stenosperma TaxID=217475 RepID=UPI0025ABF691|nr:uncharacterized protein LOC130950190 [Arachis stenosperma]
MGSLAYITLARRTIVEEVYQLETDGTQFELGESGVFLAHVRTQSSIIEHIKAAQSDDPKLRKLMKDVCNGRNANFSLDQDVLRCGQRLCVPDSHDLKKAILEEAHNSKYTVHPDSNKMYQDLKQLFWWEGMKKDIGIFVSHCLTYQQVKARGGKAGRPAP